MNCPQIQESLLSLDNLDDSALPAGVALHLQSCPPCRRMLAKLQQLEAAAQAMPVPADSDSASVRFRQQWGLPEATPPVRVFHANPRRQSAILATIHRKYWRYLAVAASLLICAGLLLPWMLTDGGQQAAAAEPLVDRLVDWNVQLAQADTAQQREQIFASGSSRFNQEINKGGLSPDDSALAQKLVVSGATLTHPDDPVAQAEQFEDIASFLLQRIQIAANAGDTRQVRRLSRNYALIAGKGLHPKLERARASSTAVDRRLQRLIGQNAALQERLDDLLEKSPDAPRKEILRQLGLAGDGKHKLRRSESTQP